LNAHSPNIIPRFIQKIQQDATVYQNFISYLREAQNVSGNTLPIIRSLKPLADSGFAYAVSVQQLLVQQPSTYAKPEAASAVLGS